MKLQDSDVEAVRRPSWHARVGRWRQGVVGAQDIDHRAGGSACHRDKDQTFPNFQPESSLEAANQSGGSLDLDPGWDINKELLFHSSITLTLQQLNCKEGEKVCRQVRDQLHNCKNKPSIGKQTRTNYWTL